MSADALLSIDVGGTRWRGMFDDGTTRAGATCSCPPPIRAGRLDPERLVEGVTTIWAKVDSDTKPDVVALASTGVARVPGDLAAMHQGLRIAETVVETVLVSDAAAGLAGALGTLGSGSILSVGTGVAAIRRDPQGVWTFKDGWGPLLGDEGGGFWIGSRGLRAALRHVDGRAGGSAALEERARSLFGADFTVWPLRGDLEAAVASIASFASSVIDAATDDEVAYGILAEAARHLRSTAAAVGDEIVYLGGGVLDSAQFRAMVLDGGVDRPLLLPARGGPLDGLGLIRSEGAGRFVEWAGSLASVRSSC